MHALSSYTLTHRLTFSRSHISLFNFFLTLVSKHKSWNIQLFLFYGNNTFIDLEKYVIDFVLLNVNYVMIYKYWCCYYFVLFIRTSIILFLKLLMQVIFSISLVPYWGFQSFMPKHTYKDSKIWGACVALIYFQVVIWQQTNRVMLQFGLCQDIPNPSHNLDKIHHTNMRGYNDTNWVEEYQ